MTDGADRRRDPPGTPEPRARLSRRRFLGAAGGLTAGAVAAGVPAVRSAAAGGASGAATGAEPFYGLHQSGITTPAQSHTYFAAVDVGTESRSELADLLQAWTAVAAGLTAGQGADPTGSDSGEALGLGPARLTVTVGLGPGLFGVGGPDRFGLAGQWPIQLVDLPAFPGDDFTAASNGGDLTVHACADDPQVAFHAVRQLLRAGDGVTSVRWSQAGFNERAASPGTPRNLLGFKDGTANPSTAAELDRYVWAGSDAPAWMSGGTYLVVRRIRLALDRWDSLPVASQERVIGRHKVSGAPLGASGEFAPLDLDAIDGADRPAIPADAHVRMVSPQANWGATLLRRSYNYSNGVVDGAGSDGEGAGLDAGLLFACYQQDPRLAFIPLFEKVAAGDALAPFTTHTASALAAVPPAAPHPGRWIGQPLFE